MKIFFKEGFYIEGIHNNIPEGAVEITKEYHEQLLNDMANGRTIISDENGYPFSTVSLTDWKNIKYKEINNEFKFIVREYPVAYINGCYYLPEYVNDYINLLPKYFDEGMKMTIWDVSGKEENSKEFTKEELMDLIRFLYTIYETAYQNKKKKEAKLEALNEINENF